jgi:hypothetical protein
LPAFAVIVTPIQDGRTRSPPATIRVPPSAVQPPMAVQPASSTLAPGSSSSADAELSIFDSADSRSCGLNPYFSSRSKTPARPDGE